MGEVRREGGEGRGRRAKVVGKGIVGEGLGLGMGHTLNPYPQYNNLLTSDLCFQVRLRC